PENRIVDANSPGSLQQGVPYPRHVDQELSAFLGTERIERRHHRIRHQQHVAAHELPLPEQRPPREQPSDYPRLTSLARIAHLAVNGRLRLQQRFVLHATSDERNTK